MHPFRNRGANPLTPTKPANGFAYHAYIYMRHAIQTSFCRSNGMLYYIVVLPLVSYSLGLNDVIHRVA